MPPQVGIGHPQKLEADHDSCKSPNDSGLAKERQSPKSNYLTLGHYVTHHAPPPDVIGVGCALRTIDWGQKTGAQAHPTNWMPAYAGMTSFPRKRESRTMQRWNDAQASMTSFPRKRESRTMRRRNDAQASMTSFPRKRESRTMRRRNDAQASIKISKTISPLCFLSPGL